MKQNILFFTLLIFIFSSCRFEHKVVEESYEDGSPKRVCLYKGKGEGRELIKETTYYPNKQAQMEGTFKDNKRDGKWVYWYENGKIWSDGQFVKGKSEGKRTTYFENGKVRYEGFYKEDMRIGKWRFFDENGRMLQEVDYSAPPKEGKR
jgi:antitoxin component YwqK of YwqJK toxin-antitoxin module